MKEMRIRIRFTEDCLGTSPSNTEIYSTYIGSKAPNAQNKEEEIASIGADAYEEKQKTIFPKLPDGTPFFWDYQIKGIFKDTCSALSRCKGYEHAKASCALKAFKKVIDGNIFVFPRKIPIQMPAKSKIGDLQRPLRASTAQGDRVALANSETIPAGSCIEMTITNLNDGAQDALIEWLNYGMYKGIGQWRNAGWGRFEWEELE